MKTKFSEPKALNKVRKKEKEVKFLHQKPITAEQLYQLQRKVSNWHKFYHTKVFLPLTRNL